MAPAPESASNTSEGLRAEITGKALYHRLLQSPFDSEGQYQQLPWPQTFANMIGPLNNEWKKRLNTNENERNENRFEMYTVPVRTGLGSGNSKKTRGTWFLL